MSSVRRPDHSGSAALGVPPAQRIDPGLDSSPAELPLEPPALDATPSHLVPCGQCGALNGRSAMVCWGCEADLLAFAKFAAVAPPRPPEPVVVPVVHAPTVVERDGSTEGRRGLHLVSRVGAPVSVSQVPAPVTALISTPTPTPTPTAPDPLVELPVLTAQVDEPVPALDELRIRPRYPLPMVALALAAMLLILVAVGLRWWGAPVAVASPPLAGNPANTGALERPFAPPARADAPDRATLSFPALEVAPSTVTADRPAPPPPPAAAPAAVFASPTAPARAGGRARETRSAAAPAAGVATPVRQRKGAPAPCTSNMAALGFCTLEPASAKE
ncbi:MAG: hypothetical protein ABI433_16645 [Burkholderiaceae bacterium]